MMPSLYRSLLLVLIYIFVFIETVEGQFGIPKQNAEGSATATNDGDQHQDQQPLNHEIDFDISKYQEAATILQMKAPNLDAQDALDLAVLLDAAGQDPETKVMVDNLSTGAGSARLEAFEDSTTQAEMVMGLKQTLDELKALEYLFQDPARAVVEMHKDGMIDEKRVDYYRENPEELANDTRKGLYFSFVSLAVAAGFL